MLWSAKHALLMAHGWKKEPSKTPACCGLTGQVDVSPLTKFGKNRAKGFRKSQFSMGHTKFKIPMSHPRGNIKSSDCYLCLELKGEVGLETES